MNPASCYPDCSKGKKPVTFFKVETGCLCIKDDKGGIRNKGSSKNKLDNIALRFRSDWADCEVTKPQD
ncbi:MAG: hypothetical protein U9O82_10575 [Thermodesulfobacteriota bacterium]|nr:hypothetical protein [Thermodesulfobacteriota bacterium]